MDKDFDLWNEIKKITHRRSGPPFFYAREIWWCSLGLNIGSEEDGKNELFERPVLILKVFNKKMIRVVPLTSKIEQDKNHILITYVNNIGTVKISQLKIISTKRLSRKLCSLSNTQFNKVVLAIHKTLI